MWKYLKQCAFEDSYGKHMPILQNIKPMLSRKGKFVFLIEV